MVVRSTWDYLDHLEEFRAGSTGWARSGPLHNPAPGRSAWNLDKRYLLDLAAAGVPVIPTRVCDDPAAVDAALAAVGGEVGGQAGRCRPAAG